MGLRDARGHQVSSFSANQKHRRPENGAEQLNARKQGNRALFNCCSWLQPTSGCLEKQHTHTYHWHKLNRRNKETTGVKLGVASRRRMQGWVPTPYQRVGSIILEY